MKVQFPSCVIEFTRTTLDTNIENGIFFITLTMDLKQNENLALLPKLKVILISLLLQHEHARVNPWFSKKSFLWTSQRKEVSHMSHSCDVNKVNKHRSYSWLQQTAWPFSKDSIFRRETWTNEKERSLLESSSSSNKGRVNIKSRIIIPFSCKEFPFKSVKCQTKFTNSLSLTTEK